MKLSCFLLRSTCILLTTIGLWNVGVLNAQTISVKASVVDSLHRPLSFVIIANKTTGSAQVYMNGAGLQLQAQATDTLVFSARGFGMRKYAVKDSLKGKNTASFKVYLLPLHQQLHEVQIIATKSPDVIRKEIDQLHLENPNTNKHYDAFNNPITALYEAFNKNERAKREVAAMEYHDAKKKILKETCRLLMTYDVMRLNEDQLEAFVNYLDINEEFLKQSTNYELGVAIKMQYLVFKAQNRF